MIELAIYALVIIISSLVVWKGGGLLENSAEVLSKHYKLSPIVQGSIVTAVGSSFPELSTTVISTLIHGEFDLGVSAIVGSAIFNILVIPGLSAILSKGVNSEWSFVMKDVQFYIISILILTVAFALAVIYFPTAEDPLVGELTRWIALIPFLFYFLYLYFQQKEAQVYQEKNQEREKSDQIGREWVKFFISLVLIVASVEGLVRSAIFLGDFFQTPNFIWGVLVLATATSIPDAIVSIKEARHGKGLVSLANVIGSNIFDLLIAVPAGVLIAGTSLVDFSVVAPMTLFLGIATVVLIILLIRKNKLSPAEGWMLLALYGLFIAWIVLETTGQLSFIT